MSMSNNGTGIIDEFHEAANIFPLDEEHIDELAADIRKNGLRVPIETLDGKIIDGRRRHLACGRVGVKPTYRAVQEDDPIAYVLTLNLHRRHLTPSQAAMVGARVKEMYNRQAKERQREAGKTHGRGKEKVPVNLPEPIGTGDARDQAARAVGVSGKTIDYATKVITRAIPEVVKAVDEGRMAVSTAAILASEPEEVQRQEVEFDARGRKRARKYKSGSGGAEPGPRKEPSAEAEEDEEIKLKGVGVFRANEAIDCLTRIPKNDALRKRGFQIVTDWIKRNP
jgi:ParB-like chromosome segregation protein Spo0J